MKKYLVTFLILALALPFTTGASVILKSTGKTTVTNTVGRKWTVGVSPTKFLTNGLVGYWTFDGKDTPWTSAIAATTKDYSTNGNTGTLTSMNRATSTAAGKIGQGLNFNGTSQYVSLGNISALQMGTSDWTVSAWIRSPAPSGLDIYAIVVKSGYFCSGLFNGWALAISNNGHLEVTLANGGACTGIVSVDDGAIVTDGKWHHVVGTWTRSGNALRYVDGQVTGTAFDISGRNGTNITTTQQAAIGGRDPGGGLDEFYKGTIDDVRVYNRALSATEVMNLYRVGY